MIVIIVPQLLREYYFQAIGQLFLFDKVFDVSFFPLVYFFPDLSYLLFAEIGGTLHVFPGIYSLPVLLYLAFAGINTSCMYTVMSAYKTQVGRATIPGKHPKQKSISTLYLEYFPGKPVNAVPENDRQGGDAGVQDILPAIEEGNSLRFLLLYDPVILVYHVDPVKAQNTCRVHFQEIHLLL
jgi:hypothetical protein